MSESEVSRNSNVTTSSVAPSAKVTIDTTFKAKLIHVYLLGKIFWAFSRNDH